MSMKTWKEEFYPVEANEVDEADALAHSYKKWSGLKPENLEKHDVELIKTGDTVSLYDKLTLQYFYFGTNTCALCLHFFNCDNKCKNCPIVKNGFRSCLHKQSAYNTFCNKGNPLPMIKVLEKCVKKVGESKTPATTKLIQVKASTLEVNQRFKQLDSNGGGYGGKWCVLVSKNIGGWMRYYPEERGRSCDCSMEKGRIVEVEVSTKEAIINAKDIKPGQIGTIIEWGCCPHYIGKRVKYLDNDTLVSVEDNDNCYWVDFKKCKRDWKGLRIKV